MSTLPEASPPAERYSRREEDRFRRALDALRRATDHADRVLAIGYAFPLGDDGRATPESLAYNDEVVMPACLARNQRAGEVVAIIRGGRGEDRPSSGVVLDGRVYVAFGPEADVSCEAHDFIVLDGLRSLDGTSPGDDRRPPDGPDLDRP